MEQMNHIQPGGVLRRVLLILLLSLAIDAGASGSNWQIPDGTKARFTIDGMMGMDVNGTLTFSKAAIVFDPASPQGGSMNVTLSVNSIATGIGKRDKHLKTDDFFDAPKYPAITFRSSSLQKDGNGYKVTGTLTIKNVSKTVTIPFTFSQNGQAGTFKGRFNIDRAAYGVGSGKEKTVGNEVRIQLDIPVRKA